LAIQLEPVELEPREAVRADGRRRSVPYVGPGEIRFRNRRCFNGGLVLGVDVRICWTPLEDIDLVVRPQLQSVDGNPERPNMAVSLAKWAVISSWSGDAHRQLVLRDVQPMAGSDRAVAGR
jgi:hypothetical protein